MTVTAGPALAPRTPTRTVTTRADDLRLLVGAGLLVAGLFSDGWAHANMVDDLESFVTPYHVVIFSGFAVTTLVVGSMLRRGRSRQADFAGSVPAGYAPAVAAIGMFAVGFLGDGVWHTAFGIESDIDALLSPTHLLMFAAVLMLFTSPWRAAAARRAAGLGTAEVGWSERLPELVSVGLTTLTVAFFVLYLWVVDWGLPTTAFVEWFGGATADGDFAVTLSQVAFMASSFVMTVVLVAPVLVLARRMGRLPRWTATAMLVTVGVGMAAVNEFAAPEVLGMYVLAGLAGDAVAARPDWSPRGRLLVLGGVIPLVLWSTYWLSVAAFASIGWEPELWIGQVAFAGLVGIGLASLLLPAATDT